MTAVTIFKSVVPLLPLHHRELLNCLKEAIESTPEGEVIVRSDAHSGRIYTTQKSIAWVIVSTRKETLSNRLVDRGLLEAEDFEEVLKECKQSGSNFGETLIDWGLVDEDTLRRELLLYIAEAMLDILCWPTLQTMFVPSTRSAYRGNLLFNLEEVLETIGQIDVSGRTRLGSHLSFKHSEREQSPRILRMASSVPQGASIDSHNTRVSAILPKKEAHGKTDHPISGIPIQALDEYFEDLRRVHGFRAIGIFETSGKLLRSEPPKSDKQLENVVIAFKRVLDKSRTACQSLGWRSPSQIILTGEQGGLLYNSVIYDEKSPVYLIALVASDGSFTLVRMIMQKIITRLMDELKGNSIAGNV